MATVTCPCGKPGKKINGGLCDSCLDKALRAEAKKIAKRLGK